VPIEKSFQGGKEFTQQAYTKEGTIVDFQKLIAGTAPLQGITVGIDRGKLILDNPYPDRSGESTQNLPEKGGFSASQKS